MSYSKKCSRGVTKKHLFDPELVKDMATFDVPQQFPAGIPHVFVGGTPIVLDGEHTGATPGMVIRKSY